jgi:uncharacterized protein YbjQ (UPF0145 family)
MDGNLTPVHRDMGIGFDGDNYTYLDLKFSSIADAVAHYRKEKESPKESPKESSKESAEKLSSIILTTVSSLSNSPKYQELEIITAECVYGMNLFRDVFASFSDIFGGRSGASQKVLRDLRKTCLEELRNEAYEIGADAVIGVDLDYSEFSGEGKSMLFLVASGTAVKFLDEPDEADTVTGASDI